MENEVTLIYNRACRELTIKTQKGHRIGAKKISHDEALEILKTFRKEVNLLIESIESKT